MCNQLRSAALFKIGGGDDVDDGDAKALKFELDQRKEVWSEVNISRKGEGA
jgi:hypothetical protein